MLEGEGAAAHVTMLQRSPTWVSAVPSRDRDRPADPGRCCRRGWRTGWSGPRTSPVTTGFYQFCRRRPQAARRLLTRFATRFLGDPALVEEHFTPAYAPWDQRLCSSPGGDLFRAVRSGRATMVTDLVRRVVPEGVETASGRTIEADVLVTATGLRLRAFGGIRPRVDGVEVDLSEQTGVERRDGDRGAELRRLHRLHERLVDAAGRPHPPARGQGAAVDGPPRRARPSSRARRPGLTPRPLLDLASGYVQRSVGAFPRQGDRRPWQVRQNYVLDAVTTLRAPLDATLVPVSARSSRRPWSPWSTPSWSPARTRGGPARALDVRRLGARGGRLGARGAGRARGARSRVRASR